MNDQVLKGIYDAAPIAGSLMAFLLGKATRSGADRNELRSLRKDVSELRKARIDQGATLAAHTAMHEGYVRTLDSVSKSMDSLKEDVAYIRGRIDSQ